MKHKAFIIIGTAIIGIICLQLISHNQSLKSQLNEIDTYPAVIEAKNANLPLFQTQPSLKTAVPEFAPKKAMPSDYYALERDRSKIIHEWQPYANSNFTCITITHKGYVAGFQCIPNEKFQSKD